MKYKIGEVSKILNIPIDTLRYYEKKHIINPHKDNSNNYRIYESWDINFLLEYKKFRRFDFSICEIEEILYHDNLEKYTNKINGRQAYFDEKLKYYTLAKQKNQEFINSLNNINNNLWKCTFTNHPDIYYFTHRFNREYDTKDKFDGLFEIWLEYFPFVECLVEMQKNAVLNRYQNNNDYRWGFAIKKEYADAFNIPLNDKVKHVESILSVYTVICAGERGTFSLKLLDKALEFIEENGYQIAGDVTGNLLARVHDPSGYHRYIEVWLPVKNRR